MLLPFPSPFLGVSAGSRMLAYVVVVLLVGGGAYRWGYTAASNAARALDADAAERASEDARHAARARLAADTAFARKAVSAQQAGVSRRVALEADIARRPASPDCGLDADSLRLLNDGIQAANRVGAAAHGLPGALPADTSADQREPGQPP